MPLSPTLWRSCRVLMNPVRLRCLHVVVQNPDACVSFVAKELRLPLPLASQYLRDLQARGVLKVRRRSRWVFYAAKPDSSVQHAAPLLAALAAAIDVRATTLRDIVRLLDGCSHPRRLIILRHMRRAPVESLLKLRHETGISVPALKRHLAKLERCGWVRHDARRWTLAGELPRLARQLLVEVDA